MDQRSISQVAWTLPRIGGAALVLTLGMASFMPVVSSADQSSAIPVSYQIGTITGIYETTFQIDQRTYSLTPDAVLLDRHGDELRLSHLRVDIEVKYHLQKDSKDKIDRMILLLPE